MKKLICILLAAATAAGCEKDDPTRYDMSQGRVCFPGAAPNETAEYPGYSNSDSTFYASMTFKQQPEGVAEAVIEVPVKLIGGASGSDRKIGVRVLEEGTTAQPGQYEILGAEVPAGKTYGAIRIEVAKSAELDTQQRELTLCLTDSPDLRVGPDRYLKANVSWHNMLPRPATTKQWSTYNAFIESEAYLRAARRRRLTARPATSCCWTSSAGRCSPTGDPITATTSTPGAPGHRPGTTNGRPPTPVKSASTNQAP